MAPEPIKLSSPHYRVVLGDPNDETTWSETTIRTFSTDMMRAEQIMARAKENVQSLPMRYGAICVWAALKRRGDVDSPWEDFERSLVDLDQVGETVAVPTQPAPEAG